MNNKGRTIVLLVISVLVSIGAVRFIMTFKKEAEDVEVIEVKKLVQLEVVKTGQHQAEIKLTGQLSAIDKLELFSEVSGILMNEGFKEGNSFKKGEVLLDINANEFANSLKAQKSVFISQIAATMADLKTDFQSDFSQWEQFLNDIDVQSTLPELPMIKDVKLKRFLSGKNILNTYYSILSQEEKLAKYHFKAPFNGVVTNSLVNKGALVRVGQKLGEFINPNLLEYETEVSLSDLKFLKTGNSVVLYSSDLNQYWKGKVSRINQKIETGTQRVKVYVLVTGEGLKEGMFLSGSLKSENFNESYVVDRMELQDDQVFLYNSGKAKLKQIEIMHINDNEAIVKGLNNGDSLIVGNLKGVYNNAKVIVE